MRRSSSRGRARKRAELLGRTRSGSGIGPIVSHPRTVGLHPSADCSCRRLLGLYPTFWIASRADCTSPSSDRVAPSIYRKVPQPIARHPRVNGTPGIRSGPYRRLVGSHCTRIGFCRVQFGSSRPPIESFRGPIGSPRPAIGPSRTPSGWFRCPIGSSRPPIEPFRRPIGSPRPPIDRSHLPSDGSDLRLDCPDLRSDCSTDQSDRPNLG